MAKKSFIEDINPAMQFITDEKQSLPEGYKINHAIQETKSKRFQLLIQPSLHEQIKQIALSENKSVNDCIHKILEEYVKGVK